MVEKNLKLISHIFIGIGFLCLFIAGVFYWFLGASEQDTLSHQKSSLTWLTISITSYLIGRIFGFIVKLKARK